MSNRARRLHTHTLRRRLLSQPEGTVLVTIRIDGRRPRRQFKALSAALTPQPSDRPV